MTEVTRDFIDLGDDKFAVQASQDVQPILDANKEDQTFNPTGYSPSRDMKHVARIPLIVAEQWLNDYGIDVFNQDHKPAVRRLLNNRDWLFVRTGGGVL